MTKRLTQLQPTGCSPAFYRRGRRRGNGNARGFDMGMIIAVLNTNGGTVPENCGG